MFHGYVSLLEGSRIDHTIWLVVSMAIFMPKYQMVDIPEQWHCKNSRKFQDAILSIPMNVIRGWDLDSLHSCLGGKSSSNIHRYPNIF